MAGAAETLTLTGLADWLGESGRKIGSGDLREPLEACHVIARQSVLENFATGTAPDGSPWAPLKHPRANSKGDDQPLRDQGFLMAASTGGSGGSVEITDTELVMANNLEYAGVHQYGATIFIPAQERPYPETPFVFTTADGETIFSRKIKEHSVTVPQRQFLGWKDSDVEKCQIVFADWMIQQVE